MKISFEDKRYPFNIPQSRAGTIFGPLESRVAYTFSGKSALATVLRYLRTEGALKNKSEQVLVPEWLGTWVYMIMHNYCFPTTVMNKKVRALMVYHQWGFPQKMEKILAFAKRHGLFVVEDCAHTIDSTYKGKRAGTFGDVSIWSLSKFFSTPVGGALYTRNKKLRSFITREYRNHDKRLEREALSGLHNGGAEIARAYALYDRLTVCPASVKAIIEREYKNGALEKRRENFALIRKKLWGRKEESLLEDSEVVPWMVPLFAGAANKKIAAVLSRAGFESGVYHFDVNRNMFRPRFVECVAVPCHQKLSGKVIRNMIEIIKAARKV